MRLTSALYRFLGGHCRQRRLRDFTRQFGDCHSLVDLGGRVDMWRDNRFPAPITVVNIEPPPDPVPATFTYICGDARQTALPDGAFDLAFSNSVIEHVGDFADQKRFAREMLRLGRHIYCQTPNRWFPVEPHFLGLFIHWFPRRWFGYVFHRYFTMQGLTWKPDRQASRKLIDEIRLLTRRELTQLFPGCHIKAERFLGLTKSYVVWK